MNSRSSLRALICFLSSLIFRSYASLAIYLNNRGTNNLEAISNKNQTRTSKSDSKWLSSGGWRRRASVARTVRAPPALRRAAVNLREVHALVLGQLAVELDERLTHRHPRYFRVYLPNPLHFGPGEIREMTHVAGPTSEEIDRRGRHSFCERRQRRQLLLLSRLHFCLSLV